MTDHATSVCSTTTDSTTWMLAKGFSYSGIVGGLRSEPNRRDIGVILSEVHCSAAGVFTLKHFGLLIFGHVRASRVTGDEPVLAIVRVILHSTAGGHQVQLTGYLTLGFTVSALGSPE